MTTLTLHRGRWSALLVAVGLGVAALAATVAATADDRPTSGQEDRVLPRNGDVTIKVKQ